MGKDPPDKADLILPGCTREKKAKSYSTTVLLSLLSCPLNTQRFPCLENALRVRSRIDAWYRQSNDYGDREFTIAIHLTDHLLQMQPASTLSTWDSMHELAMHKIFGQLGSRELQRCRMVSKYWNLLINAHLKASGTATTLESFIGIPATSVRIIAC